MVKGAVGRREEEGPVLCPVGVYKERARRRRRAPSLIDEEEDEKGARRTRACSLIEEDRTRWGPGG